MSRLATVFTLLLVLLMQSQAAVWAAAAQPAREPAQAASEVSAMPCHGSAETAVAGDHGESTHHGAMTMDCCDDGEACGNCAAACVAAPALPAGTAQLADYVEAHFASVWQSESVLIPPPLDLLRPPITLLR